MRQCLDFHDVRQDLLQEGLRLGGLVFFLAVPVWRVEIPIDSVTFLGGFLDRSHGFTSSGF